MHWTATAGEALSDKWSQPDVPADIYEFIYLFIYLSRAYSPVNRTGSPQDFSLIHILHKLNTMQIFIIYLFIEGL